MGNRVIIGVTSAIVIVLIVGAVIVLQGQSSAPASSPSPSAQANVKCPVAPSGPVTSLATTDTKVGDGAEAVAGGTVTVRYTGCLSDGTVFDATELHSDKAPSTFPLSGVIKGWQDGIPGMKVGGVRTLVIPPDQAYGAQGTQGIPGNSTLTFQVELVSVQ